MAGRGAARRGKAVHGKARATPTHKPEMKKYFSRPLEGTHHRRYYHLSPDGKRYTEVTISRPDGREVPEPAAVYDGRATAKHSSSSRRHWLTFGLNTKKPCLLCGEKKQLSEFAHGEGRYGVSNFCAACTKEQMEVNAK